MKLMPASSARWMIAIESSWSVLPHAPNIIAPRHSGLTLTPVLPSLRCSIAMVAGPTPEPHRRRGESCGSRQNLANHGVLRCGDLVEAAHRRAVGRPERDLGIGGGLPEDRGDRVGEGVKCLLGLG